MTNFFKQFCFYFTFVLFSFILLDCRNPFQSSPSNGDDPENVPSRTQGNVRLNIINLQDEILPRTIFPSAPVLSSYRLSFYPLSGQKPKSDVCLPVNETGDLKEIALDTGKWKITVYVRMFFEGEEEEIAEGNSDPFEVKANKNISVTINLKAKTLGEGKGKFTFKIIIPDSADVDSFSISLSEWQNETNRVINKTENITNAGSVGIIIAGSQLCESGYYLLYISIGTDRQRVFYYEAVHIYANRTTAFEHNLSLDEFVPIQILSGSVNISSLTLNAVNVNTKAVELKEVWAYSPNKEKIGYANINKDGKWEMRIVKRTELTHLHFSVILLIPENNQLELESNKIELIAPDDFDVPGINIVIDRNLLCFAGTLDPRTTGNLTKSGWEVTACTADLDVSTLALNNLPVITDVNGRWSMTIGTFNSPKTIYFNVEKIIEGKKHKRVNVYELTVSKNPVTSVIPLTVYFIPPKQVWIRGNVFPDGSSKCMLSDKNGHFTFTRNNIADDKIAQSFILRAYYENEVLTPNWNQSDISVVEYNYSNVIKSDIGLNYYDNNGEITWYNYIPNSRPPGQDNVKITLDFTNDKFFDEDAMPILKIEKCDEVFIEGGTFLMGTPSSENGRYGPSGKSSEVQHQVKISSIYVMSKEVTQKMYEELMPVPSYKNTGGFNFRHPDYPAVNISWFNAIEYANKLSLKDGYIPAYSITGTGSGKKVSVDTNANGWQLPTEAQWEYASRAGSLEAFASFGAANDYGKNLHTNLANYNGLQVDAYGYNPVSGKYIGHIAAAGSYPPNAWGLYDMHGNAWEYCWDWYGDYITSGIQTDPQGPADGTSGISGTDANAAKAKNQRIIRGGSYYTTANYLRSGHRGVIVPSDNSNNDIGFRLVRKQ